MNTLEHEFEVEYQYESRDCREYEYLKVMATNDSEAIEKVKNGEGYFKKGIPVTPNRFAFKFKAKQL